MRFKKYLIEKWENTFKIGPTAIEVFVNPTKREYNDIVKASKESGWSYAGATRAFYDSKKDKLWVWRGDVLHSYMSNKLKVNVFTLIRIEIDPHSKIVNVFEPYGEEEVFDNVKKIIEKIRNFAPQMKGYKVFHHLGHAEYEFKI